MDEFTRRFAEALTAHAKKQRGGRHKARSKWAKVQPVIVIQPPTVVRRAD